MRLLTRVDAAIAKWMRMEEKLFKHDQLKAQRAKAKAEAKKHRKERGGIEVTKDGLVRCRVCHCTEMEPCNPPCSWSEPGPGLCSNCSEALSAMLAWHDAANRPYLSALVVEFRRVTARPRNGKAAKVFTSAGAS